MSDDMWTRGGSALELYDDDDDVVVWVSSYE